MADLTTPGKRRNRTVGLAEALHGALDPALKRRGFASRDIITHWAAIAPNPYDQVAMPDKLTWPRGARGAEGATLYLRCADGHGLMLIHEAPRIAGAINRYFGYVLVGQVKLSLVPFTPGSAGAAQVRMVPGPEQQRQIEGVVAGIVAEIEDDGIKTALHRLGTAILGASKG